LRSYRAAYYNGGMMLLLQLCALRLLPLQKVCYVIAVLSWLLCIALLLDKGDPHALGIRLDLIVSMWSLMLLAFIDLFKAPAPLVLPALRWRERCYARFKYGLFVAMTISYALLFLVVVGASVKLVFLREY
jgi:hypothetical protein